MSDQPASRGRDADGRPRQQRPRDALGRPLPPGSVGVEQVPEDALPPDEALALARSLIAEGRPFGAHEVLEARWKAGPESEREYWQGLAQLCVALTHALRGNAAGAERLFARGRGKLESYRGPTHGVDIASAIADIGARMAEVPSDRRTHRQGEPPDAEG